MGQPPTRESDQGSSDASRADSARTSSGEPGLFFRKLVILLATLAVLAFLFAVRRILLLLAFTVLFAYVVGPLVTFVEGSLARRRIAQARLLAVAAIYALGVGSLGIAGSLVAPRLGRQLEHLSAEMPALLAGLQQLADRVLGAYRSQPLPSAVRDALDRLATQAGPAVTALAQGLALRFSALLPYLPWIFLIPLLSFFLLKDASSFQSVFLRLTPEGRSRWRVADLFKEINEVLASYVRVQLLVALIVSVLAGSILALGGVPFWLLLAGAAAILEFIPMLGPALFITAAGLVAATHGRAIPVVLALIALRMVVDYFVSPSLIRRGLKLHPMAIILALLCAGQLGGVVGLFLAIPFMAVGVVAYRYALLLSGSAGLLATFLHSEEPGAIPAIVPTLSAAAKPEAVEGPPDLPLEGLMVLVVDNEVDAREIVGLALEGFGARVLEADSGSQALEFLAAEKPDVLMSDIGMPHEDGFDLIRKVRALSSAGASIPAIALTGYASEEDRQRIFAAGFQLHLCKPVEAADLARAVLTVIKKREPNFAGQLQAAIS